MTEMKQSIYELKYSSTNTYLIEGTDGKLLFDTGGIGTYLAFCKAMAKIKVTVEEIDFILISHYHQDHMGIAQEIADRGGVIIVPEVQRTFIHLSDNIYSGDAGFHPIVDEKIRCFTLDDSRDILGEIGLKGQIIHTPGHSDDSISLILDSGEVFVGDLNPLDGFEQHRDTESQNSWNRLLEQHPKLIYYGHADKMIVGETHEPPAKYMDYYAIVSEIVKMIDRGYDIKKMQKKTKVDIEFIEDVTRIYLTHQNVGVQGILDRIEIKGR